VAKNTIKRKVDSDMEYRPINKVHKVKMFNVIDIVFAAVLITAFVVVVEVLSG